MANYEETSRTNYFRVTNEERYQELFNHLVSEDKIYDFTKIDKNGIAWHAFGSFGYIRYKTDEDDCWMDRDTFFNELQKILPDDEAFIFMSAGHEKLAYVNGFSVIITNKDIQYVDIIGDAIKKARIMLNNPEWTTDEEY